MYKSLGRKQDHANVHPAERDILEHVLSLREELKRLGGPELEDLSIEEDDAARDVYNRKFNCSELWRGALEIVPCSLSSGVQAEWVPTPANTSSRR
jgi:hypothetical protein